jgi:hypothetical protein
MSCKPTYRNVKREENAVRTMRSLGFAYVDIAQMA